MEGALILKRMYALCGLFLLTSCGGGDGASESTAATSTVETGAVSPMAVPTAAVTTPPPTTGEPQTSDASPVETNLAPATAPLSNDEEATKADVLARLAEYTAAEGQCVANPTGCDPAALSIEYGDGPDGTLGQYTIALIDGWAAEGKRVQDPTQTARRVNELLVQSPDSVLLVECFRDASVILDANGGVVDDSVVFGDKFMEWSRRDGRWIITSFIFSQYEAESEQAKLCGL